jgi:hypothetical protein
MNILKAVLLATLRIVFFGSLKVALFVYVLFQSDTAVTAAPSDGNVHVGGTASYTAQEGLD